MNKWTQCYHGTTREIAERIKREGFNPDCWFARHLEDAIEFGGNVILVVKFERAEIPKGWQFHVLEHYPPSRIIKVVEVKEC